MVTTAERAGVRHLAQHDVPALDVDEEVITLSDVEHSPGLGRYDDPAEIVDLAGNPRVHAAQPTDRRAGQGGYRHIR